MYSEYGVFVNCSASGMYDKTMFEAMASECLVLASSKDLADIVPKECIFNEADPNSLAQKLTALLRLSMLDRQGLASQLRNTAKQHSLEKLGIRLAEELAS